MVGAFALRAPWRIHHLGSANVIGIIGLLKTWKSRLLKLPSPCLTATFYANLCPSGTGTQAPGQTPWRTRGTSGEASPTCRT